jgi:hypothetical protein
MVHNFKDHPWFPLTYLQLPVLVLVVFYMGYFLQISKVLWNIDIFFESFFCHPITFSCVLLVSYFTIPLYK